jgi:hypothetical protein
LEAFLYYCVAWFNRHQPASRHGLVGGKFLMAAKRAIMRVQLDDVAKDRLDDICKRRGMTQIALMSRLVNWFSQQDDYIQTAVLQSLSEGTMSSLAKTLLKRLSSEKGRGG